MVFLCQTCFFPHLLMSPNLRLTSDSSLSSASPCPISSKSSQPYLVNQIYPSHSSTVPSLITVTTISPPGCGKSLLIGLPASGLSVPHPYFFFFQNWLICDLVTYSYRIPSFTKMSGSASQDSPPGFKLRLASHLP